MTATWIAAAAAALVALISVLLTYITTKQLTRRSEQIAFVGRQLSEFYGPLLALSRAGLASWTEFRRRYGEDRISLFPSQAAPDAQDVRAWKYWLMYAFMPINRRMLEIILARMDLVEGEIPQCFIDFCSHVTGLEVTLAQWEDGDYSSLSLVAQHPGASFDSHIRERYEELRRRQAALLGNFRQTHL
jgi:hypothetical protein